MAGTPSWNGSMPKNRITQHKVQSEDKIKNKKLAEARRELNEMKKHIGQLQKQLKRALAAGIFKEEDPVSLAEREGAIKQAKPACPKCGDDTPKHVQLPTGTMYQCALCSTRWKPKAKPEADEEEE